MKATAHESYIIYTLITYETTILARASSSLGDNAPTTNKHENIKAEEYAEKVIRRICKNLTDHKKTLLSGRYYIYLFMYFE